MLQALRRVTGFVAVLGLLWVWSAPLLARETIGVVLSGGGARGAAHIGVLRELERLQIPIDYIAGTSFGAYIAGLYAMGMSADEIEVLVQRIDWRQGFVDKVDRSERPIRSKQREDVFQLRPNIGFDGLTLKSPKGLVQGQSMAVLLRDSVKNLPVINDFDRLPIPYRAVATDIESVTEVVMAHGHLPTVMQASMSVPGALPPVRYEGHLLVDGGVVNNLPVSVARAMGADVVIAVDIGADLAKADQLDNALSIMNQLSTFMVRKNTAEQAALLGKRDVLLRPNVSDMSMAAFDRMPEIIARGENSARGAERDLARYSTSPEVYAAYQKRKQALRKHLTYLQSGTKIDDIVIVNQSRFDEHLIRSKLALTPGMNLSDAEMEARVRRLHALGNFERVDYQLEKRGVRQVLVVKVREKTWGPNYLDFRFALEDTLSGNTSIQLGGGATFTGLSRYGAEARLEGVLGSDKWFKAELYAPIVPNQRYFTYWRAQVDRFDRNLYFASDSNNVLVNRYAVNWGEVAFGWQPLPWQQTLLGMRYVDGKITPQIFKQAGLEGQNVGPYLGVNYDTLDNIAFPRSGVKMDLDLAYLQSRLHTQGGDETFYSRTAFTDVNMDLVTATGWGRHALIGKFSGGALISDDPLAGLLRPKDMGGFLRLSGFEHNQLSGQYATFGALIYQYRWRDNDFGLFRAPLYFGMSVEHGRVWDKSSSLFDRAYQEPVWASSVFTGIDSPIGPIYFAYGQAEGGHHAVYFTIGRSL